MKHRGTDRESWVIEYTSRIAVLRHPSKRPFRVWCVKAGGEDTMPEVDAAKYAKQCGLRFKLVRVTDSTMDAILGTDAVMPGWIPPANASE